MLKLTIKNWGVGSRFTWRKLWLSCLRLLVQ